MENGEIAVCFARAKEEEVVVLPEVIPRLPDGALVHISVREITLVVIIIVFMVVVVLGVSNLVMQCQQNPDTG